MSKTLKEMELESIMNEIHHKNCLTFMKDIPDNYFDLVLTDPPYGIGMDGKVGIDGAGKAQEYAKKEWDKETPSQEIFDEIFRVSKNQIIFGANYFISKMPYNSSCWLFWDKNNAESFFADGEMAWTSFNTAVRKYTFTWHGFIQQDMGNKEKRHHPTQKPTELFKNILRDYAIKNGLKKIYDPFMGSGTTAIACKSLGLDWCGTELDEEYVSIANKRLSKVQGSLF